MAEGHHAAKLRRSISLIIRSWLSFRKLDIDLKDVGSVKSLRWAQNLIDVAVRLLR